MAAILAILAILVVQLSAGPVAASKLTDAQAAIEYGDLKTGIRLLTELAHEGNAEAQHNLGIANEHGLGVPKNLAKAVQWYQRAAAQGHTGAQTNLGLAYASGRGVKKDLRTAEMWWRRAAHQGSVLAAYNLGHTLMHTDDKAASRYTQQAANAGFGPAMCLLASMYRTGLKSLPRNPEQYFRWSIKGAALNELSCIFQVGQAYYDGLGTEKNYQKAYEWLYLAQVKCEQCCAPCDQPGQIAALSELEQILSEAEIKRAKRAAEKLQRNF